MIWRFLNRVLHYKKNITGKPGERGEVYGYFRQIFTGRKNCSCHRRSYGIGFAIATAYAEAGATIVFNDIKQELVDKGIAAYEEKGIKAHGYVCDVTDEEQVNELIAKIEKEVA